MGDQGGARTGIQRQGRWLLRTSGGGGVLDMAEAKGVLFSVQWVLLHMDIFGNEQANKVAEQGRVRHGA